MKEGWEKKKLGEVAEINPNKRQTLAQANGDEVSFLPMEDLGIKEKYTNCLKTINLQENSGSYTVFAENDILLAKVTPCFENGKLGIAKNLQNGIGLGSSEYHILRATGVNKEYLYYFLQNNHFVLETSKNFTGTSGLKRVSKDFISNYPVPVPPLSVQESIVSELDMLSGIISKHKALQEEYDRLEQSIFYDMFGDPVTNEKGWDKKTLDSLYKVSSSKRIMQSEWTTSGIPFLKVADFVSMIQGNTPSPLAFISEEKYDELKKDNLIPRENDILITSRGTLGLCYIVKDSDAFYFQDGMVSWLSNSNGEILSDYLVKIFKYPSFIAKLNETSNKSTVAYVSISQLSKIQVPVPPLSLQQSFADKISAIEQMKAKNKAAQEEAEMLFNERMAYYF